MINIYDKDGGKETLIGSCDATVSELIRHRVGDTDQVGVKDIFKVKDDKGMEKGMLVVVEASITGTKREADGPASGPAPKNPRRDLKLTEESELHLTLAGIDLKNIEWATLSQSDPFFAVEGLMKGFASFKTLLKLCAGTPITITSAFSTVS